MPLEISTTSPLSIKDIALEFGGSPPYSFANYYANGSYVYKNSQGFPDGVAEAIPASGQLDIQNFYGAKKDSKFGFEFVSYNVSLSKISIASGANSIWATAAGLRRSDKVMILYIIRLDKFFNVLDYKAYELTDVNYSEGINASVVTVTESSTSAYVYAVGVSKDTASPPAYQSHFYTFVVTESADGSFTLDSKNKNSGFGGTNTVVTPQIVSTLTEKWPSRVDSVGGGYISFSPTFSSVQVGYGVNYYPYIHATKVSSAANPTLTDWFYRNEARDQRNGIMLSDGSILHVDTYIFDGVYNVFGKLTAAGTHAYQKRMSFSTVGYGIVDAFNAVQYSGYCNNTIATNILPISSARETTTTWTPPNTTTAKPQRIGMVYKLDVSTGTPSNLVLITAGYNGTTKFQVTKTFIKTDGGYVYCGFLMDLYNDTTGAYEETGLYLYKFNYSMTNVLDKIFIKRISSISEVVIDITNQKLLISSNNMIMAVPTKFEFIDLTKPLYKQYEIIRNTYDVHHVVSSVQPTTTDYVLASGTLATTTSSTSISPSLYIDSLSINNERDIKVIDEASSNTNGTAAASISVTLPTSIKSGDILLMYAGAYDAIPSLPTGWVSLHNTLGYNNGIRLAYKVATDNDKGSSVSTSFSPVANGFAYVYVIRGVDITKPFTVPNATIAGNGNTWGVPSVTSSRPNSLAMFFVTVRGCDISPLSCAQSSFSYTTSGLTTTASCVSGLHGYRFVPAAGVPISGVSISSESTIAGALPEYGVFLNGQLLVHGLIDKNYYGQNI